MVESISAAMGTLLMRPRFDAGSQQALCFTHAPEHGSVSKAAEYSMQTVPPPVVPETDSQAAASSQTPEDRANAEATEFSVTPVPAGTVSETGEHAPACELTPDVACGEVSVSTPVPANGAPETEVSAALR